MKKEIVRNITPNFIRFRKTPLPKPLQKYKLQRSSSRNSRNSFHQYQNIIISSHKTKLPMDCYVKSQKILNIVRNNKLIRDDSLEKKSKEKQKGKERSGSFNSEKNKHDMRMTSGWKQKELVVKRKLSSSNKSLIQYKNQRLIKQQGKERERQRYRQKEKEKQVEVEFEKEEMKAFKFQEDILKNLTKIQKPEPMIKFKIRREDSKRKPSEKRVKVKRFFANENIVLNSIQNLNKYEIYGELGKGAYGVVRMAYDKIKDLKVALKIYQKSNLNEQNKINNVEREILIQTKLNHPTIAKIIESIQAPEEIIIVQQYGGANSLYRYLLSKPQHKLQQKQAKQFFKRIVQSIQYLHSQGIVHRDIKAQNILINRNHQLKLIDFGFSLFNVPPDTIDTFCGTPTYMAPQIVSKIDHVARYTDIWSLGILLFVLLQGNYPFRARTEDELFENIRKGQFQFIWNEITEESKRMIKWFLKVDPYQRPVLAELIQSQEWKVWHSV